MFALRNVTVAFLMVVGILVPAIAQANEACVKKHLSKTAFRLDVKLGAPAETDEQRIAAFVNQAGLDIGPSDYAELCKFLGTETGVLALDNAYLRVLEQQAGEEPNSAYDASYSGPVDTAPPPPVAAFIFQTNFGSFVFEPSTNVELGFDARRFGFELKSKKSGEYLSTVNFYTSNDDGEPAIYFLISEDSEKISTASKISEELEPFLTIAGPHQILKIDKEAAACGFEIRRLPVRTDRSRYKIAIKAMFDLLLAQSIDIPSAESDAIRDLISYCFFQRFGS